MASLPSIKAKKQFEIALWFAQFIGTGDIENEDKLHPRLGFIVFMGAVEQIMHVHGFKQIWPDVAQVCNSFAILCIILQLYCRLASKFIRKDNEILRWLLGTVVSFYEQEEQNHTYREILERHLKVSHFLLNCYSITCLAVYCCLNPAAWILSWYTSEFILFTPIYLPFFEPTTLSGFIISSALLVPYTLLVYFLVMPVDTLFMFFVYQCIPMIDILCHKLKQFGEDLVKMKYQEIIAAESLESSTSKGVKAIAHHQALEQERKNELEKVEKQLILLIKQFYTYNEYVLAATRFAEMTTFAAMTLDAMAIAMAAVVAIHYSKVIGVVLVLVVSFQVVVPCIQGTLLSNLKQILLEEVYGFPWYELSRPKQKIFLQFIHFCQESNEFEIPIIGKINMELFKDLMNEQFEDKLWIARAIGTGDIDNEDKLHPRLAFIVLMGAVEQVMHVHGFKQIWPDVAQVCNSFALLCFILQLYIRLVSKFIRKDNESVKYLLDTLVAFYKQEEQNHIHRQILERHLKVSHLLLNGYLIVCLVVYCSLNPAAWILSWYTGEFILFTPIYLPFFDPNTLNGFIISSVLLVPYTFLVYFLVMIMDTYFMFFVYQCIPMVDILCLKLKKWCEDMVNFKRQKLTEIQPLTSKQKRNFKSIAHQQILEIKRKKKIKKVEKQLIELIKQFRIYNEYVLRATKYVEMTTFAAMTLDSFSIAMSAVVALYYSKVIGGTFVMVLFFQVLVSCLQGTMITNQKQKLLEELCGFPWYELPTSKQKIFLQFIHLCQNSNEFQVTIIGKVNLELFKDLMNGSYSYLMYLLKFEK